MKILTYKDIEKNLATCHQNDRKALALLPVGCVEQHGPYLPMETDSIIAQSVALGLCESMTRNNYWCHVYPPIHYTPTQSNLNFSGTVTIPDDSFRVYARQVCSSIMRTPFDALIIVSGHGGADPALREIGFWQVNEQFTDKTPCIRPVAVLCIYDLSPQLETRFGQKSGKHADWREFLLLYHLLGDEYFDAGRIQALKEFKKNNQFAMASSSIYGVPVEYRSVSGVIGEPLPDGDSDWKSLTAELWKYLLQRMTENLIHDLETFRENRMDYSPAGDSV